MDQHKFTLQACNEDYQALYIKEPADAIPLMQGLLDKSGVFAVDLETYPKEEYKHIPKAALSADTGRARLIIIAQHPNVVVFDLLYLATNADFVNLLAEFLTTKELVGHNFKFDIGFFLRWGVRKMDPHCTMLMAKVFFHTVYHNDSGISYSLANLLNSLKLGKVNKASQVSDWGNPNLLFDQVYYAAVDGIATLALYNLLIRGIKKANVEQYYTLCRLAQLPLAEMEQTGLALNVREHKKLIQEWSDSLYKNKKEVLRYTKIKGDLTNPAIAKWLEANLPPEILTVWPRTPSERLKTDMRTLEEYGTHDLVKPLTEFKKREKLVSTYGSTLVSQINPHSNKIHTHYNIAGARTGRLSSSRPNLQNIPRDSDIRNNFIADEGNVFLYGDYNQIELRVAAELSQDSAMLMAFREGIDLHALTASKISGVPLEEVTSDDRRKAKAFNFGLLFGLGANSFSDYAKASYGVEVSNDEALHSIAQWRELYEGYYKWQQKIATEGRKTLFVRTPMGKLRKLAADNTYGTSMNTPVQGGAAECLLYSLILMRNDYISRGLRARLANTVHDEVLVLCPYDEIADAAEVFRNAMIEGFKRVFPNGCTVNLIDIGVGTTWSEAKKDSES